MWAGLGAPTAAHAVREPVLERVAHSGPPLRPQPALYLLMQLPELIPHRGLGPAGDLRANARPVRLVTHADRAANRFLDSSR